jgi:hypothetical protein
MIAGIIGVPSRAAQIEKLTSVIAPSVDRVEVLMDHQYKGNWWNHSRGLELLKEAKPGEPVLIMTDDAVTVPDWRERWERIHYEAQNSIYSLLTLQRHVFNPENLQRGYVTKCQPRGFYDVAVIYIDRQTFHDDVKRWFYNEGGSRHPKVVKRATHLDVVIQEYLIEHNIPWTITVPTLFDHADLPSTLSHSSAGSPNYVGQSRSFLPR